MKRNRQSARDRLGQGAKRRRYQKFQPYTPRTLLAQSEMKYFSLALTSTAIANPASWIGTELDHATTLCLFAPTQGAEANQRIGRKVSVVRVAIRGLISVSTAQDDPDVLPNPPVRLILYMDKQTNGVQSQGEDVMETYEASIANTFNGFQNVANFGRFQVLRDKIYRPVTMTAGTDGVATLSIAGAVIPFKMNYRFPTPLTVRFNATDGGTVADIVDNSFHIIGIRGNSAYGGTITYTSRVYFKDI